MRSKLILIVVKLGFICIVNSLLLRDGWTVYAVRANNIYLPNTYNLGEIDRIIGVALKIADSDNRSALDFISQAYKMALERKDSLRMVHSGRIQGQILNRLGYLDSAIRIFKINLPIAERHGYSDDCKRILNSLGLACTFKGDYGEALNHHLKSLEARESGNDKFEISVALQNIGIVYFKLGAYENALSYFNKSWILRLGSLNAQDMPALLINMALCHVYLKNYDSAFNCIGIARSFCQDNCNHEVKAQMAAALGLYYKSIGKLDSAVFYFKRSLNSAIEKQDLRYQAESLFCLASISVDQDSLRLAHKYLSAATESSRLVNYKDILVETFYQWIQYYTKTNNVDSVSLYQQRFIDLNDSLQKLRRGDLLHTLSRLEERENTKIIQSQNQILRLNERAIVNHNYLAILISIIAILLLLLVTVLLRINGKNKVINQMLDLKVKQRTVDLNISYEKLRQYSDNKDSTITRIVSDFGTHFKTLTGLVTYFQKILEIPRTFRKVCSGWSQRRGSCRQPLINSSDPVIWAVPNEKRLRVKSPPMNLKDDFKAYQPREESSEISRIKAYVSSRETTTC